MRVKVFLSTLILSISLFCVFAYAEQIQTWTNYPSSPSYGLPYQVIYKYEGNDYLVTSSVPWRMGASSPYSSYLCTGLNATVQRYKLVTGSWIADGYYANYTFSSGGYYPVYSMATFVYSNYPVYSDNSLSTILYSANTPTPPTYPTQNDLSLGDYDNGLYIYSPRDNEIMMDNTIYRFKAFFKYDLPITMNNYTISDKDRIFVNNALDSQILNTLEVFFTDSDGNVYPSTTSNITINQSDYLRPMVTNEYTDPPMDGVIDGYILSPYNIDETYTLHARIRPYSSINFRNGQIGANNISINDSNVQILETEIAINVQPQSQIIDSDGDLIEDNTNNIILPPVTNIIINNNNSNGDGYIPTPIIIPDVPTINNTNVSVMLDGLTSFFGENGFFTSISAFFGELLSWLPVEVRLVLGGATTLVAILLIVKVIRG